MSYQDFLVVVKQAEQENPQSRRGQVWFNTLQVYRPDLAYQLMGTPLDPFYRDSIPGNTENFVEEQW